MVNLCENRTGQYLLHKIDRKDEKMTVGELIELLKCVPKEHTVFFLTNKDTREEEAELKAIRLLPPDQDWIDIEIE